MSEIDFEKIQDFKIENNFRDVQVNNCRWCKNMKFYHKGKESFLYCSLIMENLETADYSNAAVSRDTICDKYQDFGERSNCE